MIQQHEKGSSASVAKSVFLGHKKAPNGPWVSFFVSTAIQHFHHWKARFLSIALCSVTRLMLNKCTVVWTSTPDFEISKKV